MNDIYSVTETNRYIDFQRPIFTGWGVISSREIQIMIINSDNNNNE